MGRLTLRNVFGKARCKKNGTKFCYETDECLYCKHNDEILERLAHYEDLEEQSRLIELPCAVGDTVWDIGSVFGKTPVRHKIETQIYALFVKNLFGQRFFLTKEEAEAKLKELEG